MLHNENRIDLFTYSVRTRSIPNFYRLIFNVNIQNQINNNGFPISAIAAVSQSDDNVSVCSQWCPKSSHTNRWFRHAICFTATICHMYWVNSLFNCIEIAFIERHISTFYEVWTVPLFAHRTWFWMAKCLVRLAFVCGNIWTSNEMPLDDTNRLTHRYSGYQIYVPMMFSNKWLEEHIGIGSAKITFSSSNMTFIAIYCNELLVFFTRSVSSFQFDK